MKSFLKSQSIVLAMAVSLLSNSLLANAGVGAGGGGAAVVCKNSQGVTNSVKLLDLYEAELNSHLKIPRSAKPMVQQIGEALAKTDEFFRYDLKEQLQKISVNYLPTNVTQRQPYDLGDDPIVVEDHCSVEWVAFYRDGNESLQIVTKYFNQMSRTDQAALMIHESVYRIRRSKLDDSSSAESREIVSGFFSPSVSRNQLAELTQDMRTPSNRIFRAALPAHFDVDVRTNTFFPEIKDKYYGFGSSVVLRCYDADWDLVEKMDILSDGLPNATYSINGSCRYLLIFVKATAYSIKANGSVVYSGTEDLNERGNGVQFTVYPFDLK